MKPIPGKKIEFHVYRYLYMASALILLSLFSGSGPDQVRADDVSKRPRADHVEARQRIGNLITRIVNAYETEDPESFMAHVSENFAGGRLALDSAIRQDFSTMDNIDLQVSISNLAVASSGHIHAVLTYSRHVTSTKSGTSLHDSGMTEIVFDSIDGIPRIYAMKNPLLFGVSQASSISTGTIIAQQNGEMLGVNEKGELVIMSIDKARETVLQ